MPVLVPLLNRWRFPVVVIGGRNTGCSCESTLLEQCEVRTVFHRDWILGTRYALRAPCGGVLEDVFVVLPIDGGDARLRMQWHGVLENEVVR